MEFLRFPAEYGMHTIYTELAFGEAGLTERELEHLLSDRILHRALMRSGKEMTVHTAPRLLLRWRRIAECWPQARYIFLLRHPMNVATSGRESTGAGRLVSWSILTDIYLRYFYLLREARAELPGLSVRYEELTAHPEKTCQQVCEFLDTSWEPGMLDYGMADHGRLVPGSGDLSAKLRSGELHPGCPMPSEQDIPMPFRPICVELGYASS